MHLHKNIQIESIATALTKVLVVIVIGTMIAFGLDNEILEWNNLLGMHLTSMTGGVLYPGVVILRNKNILGYMYRRNMWLTTILEKLRPNRIEPQSTSE